jgi:hypothetical protein
VSNLFKPQVTPKTADELADMFFVPDKMTMFEKTADNNWRIWVRTLTPRMAKWLYDICVREERAGGYDRRVLVAGDGETPRYSDGKFVRNNIQFTWEIIRYSNNMVEFKVSMILRN